MLRERPRTLATPLLRLTPLLLLTPLTMPVFAASLSGRIVLDGPKPEPRPLDPGRDACCQEAGPIDERVVVGKGGGLANVVVWVRLNEPVTSSPPIQAAVLTNQGCAFRPRVVLARVGQELTLANADPTTHNLNATFRKNRSFNVVLAPEAERRLVFEAAEPKPAPVACNVHPFMRAWVMVRDDAFAAVTDETGRFAIPDGVPPGSHRVTFWHEGRYLANLATRLGETDRRGRIRVTFPKNGRGGAEGALLGEIELAASWFAEQP